MANGKMKTQFSQGLFTASSTQKERLGAKMILDDGRVFRYVKADASGLAAGKLCMAPAAVANHINKAVGAAYAIGSDTITLTVGATAVTEDQYAEGFLQVNDATGEGYSYKIESNTACDASGDTVIKLKDPIAVALVSATSEVSLIPSAFKAVTQTATEENVPVGVAVCAIAANYYGWAQSSGQGICLTSGTPAVGAWLIPAAVAGAVGSASATIATTIVQPIIGQALATAGVDTEYKPLRLLID